jgi:site-specific DNA-methyltransferase (adenine-specific)
VAVTWELREGDCLDPVTGLASLPDKSVDHVITDPPYEAEAHTLGRRCKRGGLGSVEEPLDFAPIDAGVRMDAAAHLVRTARRWIIVFCQVEAVTAWRIALEAGGAIYKRTGIWHKPDGQPNLAGDRPGMGYETFVIAHAVAPGKTRWNGGGKTAVWTFLRNQYHGQRTHHHPTEKPLALMAALVADFTDAGETILDPFAGSGTTGVACIRAGRNFIGWEKDPKYAEVARRRLGETREQAVLPLMRAPKHKQGSLL